MTQTTFSLGQIDDYLGPAQGRFFGHGYRSAEHDVRDIVVVPGVDAPARTTAVVSVRYPRDWSTKGRGVDLPPHLSTVDVLVLGVQLAELHLTHTFALDAESRRRSWLRRLVIRAGDAPQEELDDLPCVVTPHSSVRVAGSALAVTTVDCSVGAMRIQCEIQHPTAGTAGRRVEYRSLDDGLGDARRRYFGEGFKSLGQVIEDVHVDVPALRCAARVRVAPVRDAPEPVDGTEGACQPSVSMIDCFVVSLQLAQVLLYEMDSVSRRDSNTLWMMKTTLRADRPRLPQDGVFPAETAITGKHLVPLRGGLWRSVDLTGRLAGITLRASFAHRLPDSLPETPRFPIQSAEVLS